MSEESSEQDQASQDQEWGNIAGAMPVIKHIEGQRIKWFWHLTCMPMNQLALRAYTDTLVGEREADQEYAGVTPWHSQSTGYIFPHDNEQHKRQEKN